jgi:hypothetical protein
MEPDLKAEHHLSLSRQKRRFRSTEQHKREKCRQRRESAVEAMSDCQATKLELIEFPTYPFGSGDLMVVVLANGRDIHQAISPASL